MTIDPEVLKKAREAYFKKSIGVQNEYIEKKILPVQEKWDPRYLLKSKVKPGVEDILKWPREIKPLEQIEAETALLAKERNEAALLQKKKDEEDARIAASIDKAYEKAVNGDFEEKKLKELEIAVKRQQDDGAKMTLLIVEAELEKEFTRILTALRLAYRSDAWKAFKSGECSHEDFEVELLRYLREEKLALLRAP